MKKIAYLAIPLLFVLIKTIVLPIVLMFNRSILNL